MQVLRQKLYPKKCRELDSTKHFISWLDNVRSQSVTSRITMPWQRLTLLSVGRGRSRLNAAITMRRLRLDFGLTFEVWLDMWHAGELAIIGSASMPLNASMS